MAAQERNICRGCLSAGRKMIAVEEHWTKQCFLQILCEIPMYEPENNVSVRLCWECEALLRRFTEFKQRVADCYETLRNFDVLNPDMKIPPHQPKLTIHKLENINFPEPEQEISVEPCIDIKLEPSENLKNEAESDADNDLLINYVPKKKKAVKKKKKEKRVQETKLELYKEIELTESEIEGERKEMELREEYVNAMFRCEKCIVSFPNADDLKDHSAVKHDLNASNNCPICTCTFASEISLNYHLKKHRVRYECCQCAARLRSKRAAEKHAGNAHGIDPGYGNLNTQENGHTEASSTETNGVKSEATFPCTLCAKTFRWKTSLRKHLETHRIEAGQKRRPYCEPCNVESEATFPCTLCAKTFRWKTSLRKHLEMHRIEAGQKRRPYCEPCKLSFTTTSNLQKHVKTSSKHQIQLKLRKLKDTLPEDSTTPEKQQAHIEEIKCSVNNARQQYPCSHCGKKFQWRGNLLRHLHSHTARANGELVCAPCNRTFSSLATYNQHMRLSRAHVSEQQFPHACAECGRRFANKTRLRDHVDWDHRRRFVHSCKTCQKVFKSHTSLYLHKQVVHKKENAEHLCDHCGKPFPNHAKLRSHIIALHTSESPYACGACAARFSWHSCLSRHVRRVHKT